MEKRLGAATNPTPSKEELGPPNQQLPTPRGKISSPSWKGRVVVVDRDRGIFEIQDQESLAQGAYAA